MSPAEHQTDLARRIRLDLKRIPVRVWTVAVAAVLVAGLGWQLLAQGRSPAEPPPADVAVPVEAKLVEARALISTVDAGGTVEATEEVTVSARIPGRVAAVLVKEGDTVRVGQVLVRLERGELAAQAQQAEANLAAAQARLGMLEEGARPQERAQAEEQVRQAEANLRAAQARLRMLEEGARPQERAQVEAAVAQARVNYEAAKANFDRMQALYEVGAISKAQLDDAQLQRDVARAQYDTALQQQNLVITGPRLEEIEMARSQVGAAQAQLAAVRQQRALVHEGARAQEIEMARAQVAQDQAAVSFARLQLANAAITAPLSGTVTRRYVDPGDLAGPGLPLVTVAQIETVDVVVDVSETDLGRIRAGQPVGVKVDAYPGQAFRGTVHEIGQAADGRTRAFKVKVAVANPEHALKPGMFARGAITTARREQALVIPRDAVVSENGQATVFVVEAGKARQRKVRLGMASGPVVEVLSGLTSGETVVVAGQTGLTDGTAVAVR